MLLTNPPRIPSNIFLNASLPALGIFNTWNIRLIRVVMTALHPVGGADSATVTISLDFLKAFSPPRSYTPPWPINCLMHSTGGCASYFSCNGMLMSSIIRIPLLYPAIGPTTPRCPEPLNEFSINFCVI